MQAETVTGGPMGWDFKKLRRAAGLTVRQASYLTNTSDRTIRRWEGGHSGEADVIPHPLAYSIIQAYQRGELPPKAADLSVLDAMEQKPYGLRLDVHEAKGRIGAVMWEKLPKLIGWNHLTNNSGMVTAQVVAAVCLIAAGWRPGEVYQSKS